jgi:hypothetical protein
MVNTTEIKINNWFIHKAEWSYRNENHELDNKPFQWTDSDWYALGESILFIESIEPIKLSEDILQKCGLELMDKMCWVHANGFHLFMTIQEGFYKVVIGGMLIPIHHLHQLQNAFSLTGTELEVKL